MDSVTDICKYHFLCFVTVLQVKVISGHQVKKVKQKISWFRAAIHVFRSDFRKEREKWPYNTFWSFKIGEKNKIRKITVKSRNDVKSACFWHVLCYISAIFEDIDLKFCTHIHETLPSNICYGFLEILIWGETVSKRIQIRPFLKIFQNFQNFKNPRQQFCSPTNSTSSHISQLIVALKLHQWRRFSWTHFADQNRRNMTSLWRHSRLTYYDLGPNFLTQGVELLAGEVWQVSKRNSQYFMSYLRKTTGGALWAPPAGRGLSLIFRRVAHRGSQIKMNRVQNELANTMVHVMKLGTVWHIVDFLHLFVTVS